MVTLGAADFVALGVEDFDFTGDVALPLATFGLLVCEVAFCCVEELFVKDLITIFFGGAALVGVVGPPFFGVVDVPAWGLTSGRTSNVTPFAENGRY